MFFEAFYMSYKPLKPGLMEKQYGNFKESDDKKHGLLMCCGKLMICIVSSMSFF